MRAIICGAGSAGFVHALTLRALGVAIVGVYDPDRSRASVLASMHGARAFATSDSLFDCDAQIATITSPPVAHVEQAVRAHRDDRIVFVEKPVATTHAEIAELSRLPRCVPVVQWRAGRAFHAIRSAIAAGDFGSSPTANVDLAWSRDQAYFTGFRATYASWGCGVLLSVGVHALDLIASAFASPVVQVHGVIASRDGIEVETSASAIVQFETGSASVRATFDSGCERTRISFAGNGITATIEGGELDPTASAIKWECADEDRVARLQRRELECAGAIDAPLIVPFFRDALAAIKRGARPGDCVDLPSIQSVDAAHRIALDVYALRTRCDHSTRCGSPFGNVATNQSRASRTRASS